MIEFLIDLLITSVAVFLAAHFLSGIQVKNFFSAIIVALVYGLLNALVLFLLKFFGINFLSGSLQAQGFIQILFNAFLLLITDKLLKSFKIQNILHAIVGAIFISAIISLIKSFF